MAEIEIVYAETIKPSSKTPDGHKKFGLSVFDQLIPGDHTPLVLLYPDGGQNSVSVRIRKLKLSLSEALVRYYPLAGRAVKDELYVDCNDGGVDFVEAKVKGCRLSDILGCPDDKILGMLVPTGPVERGGHPLLRVQANAFECGGVAIGLRFGHVRTDACPIGEFLKGWAAVVRGDNGVPAPYLDVVASRFPAVPNTTLLMKPREACKCSSKRFVFRATDIAALKEKAANTSEKASLF